ncbi:hypothetical protein AQZ52_14955 [Novosphingobium fuchskuhlense]|uniref:SPOR domain-containing protein n=1 Tax=Novosphingobium fuchskuhlense TaxID=1117702 RepID=A0A124JTG5_9SPHN|nr:hypothetical protein [Novosphingobium fuchskuhlense]KUR70160.1 hypothetical protein AQZ52_14955 [Novosphingobium fuchskuhlense]
MMRMQRFGTAARPALIAALFVCAAAPAALQAQIAIQSPPAPAAPVAAAPNGVGSAFELTFWQSVTGSEDVGSYEAYLARYPDGTFSGLARARIAAIQRATAVQPAVAAPVPAIQQAITPPAPTPAVLTMPQATAPLAPTPAVSTAPAMTAPVPAPASIATTSAAPVPASAATNTADTPLTRLLAQLRSPDDGTSQPAAGAASAPLITPAPPVQPLPAAAPGLSAPATLQPVSAPAAVPAPATAPGPIVPAAAPVASYSSARPLLLPVPNVVLPSYFCSIDARNEFHNSAYRPAVEIATRNNEAAVAYLRQLQQTYDRGQLGRDTAVLNAIAAEARAYQAEAARAYAVQTALVHQFDALMAVPLRTCVALAQ